MLDNEDLRVERLTTVSGPSDDLLEHNVVYAFYPRQLPSKSDFGAVLHHEGLVVRRSDLVRDLSKLIVDCESPECIEKRWIWTRMHVHSQQWQVSQSICLSVSRSIKTNLFKARFPLPELTARVNGPS